MGRSVVAHSFRSFPICTYGGLFSQCAPKALERTQTLQERSEGFCAWRGSRAFPQAVSRQRIYRRLWTQLHSGKLAERILFFWLWRGSPDFEETFFEEERFVKVEEGEDLHATNYERSPGSK